VLLKSALAFIYPLLAPRIVAVILTNEIKAGQNYTYATQYGTAATQATSTYGYQSATSGVGYTTQTSSSSAQLGYGHQPGSSGTGYAAQTVASNTVQPQNYANAFQRAPQEEVYKGAKARVKVTGTTGQSEELDPSKSPLS
jgi:hypothetical protein